MPFLSRPSWVGTLAMLAAGAAVAQLEPPRATPPPGAELPYRSTLEHYQPYSEQAVGSWQDANDTVGRIGGWRAYAREAAGAADAAVPAASPAKAPAAMAPHAGHGKPEDKPR
ncbi:MAG: hypothetical protein JWQ76_2582 [Ramlibacter sp.]|nr:hypothetical protein [Ramlibacter sp.]